mmetsp:Transcript_9868/g.12489  ORF Transcript_9868/g.12489 Transcript_9868/m.12489 type:complete len:398 (-) Transcript_9868:220-1413(-)
MLRIKPASVANRRNNIIRSRKLCTSNPSCHQLAKKQNVHTSLLSPSIHHRQHNALLQKLTKIYPIRPFSAAATATAESSSKKTVGDIFLDNLGKVFLSTIGLIVAALVRSSMATTNKNDLRTKIEELASLDPFEIDDLKIANHDLDKHVMELIFKGVLEQFSFQSRNDIGSGVDKSDGLGNEDDIRHYQYQANTRVKYEDFVNVVMNIMKGLKGEGFTIELGHLLDRVVIGLLEKQELSHRREDDGKLDLNLLLVALTLCMNGTIRERTEILFDIMTATTIKSPEQSDASNGQKNQSNQVVTEKQIIEMVKYLQDTCQLVPDAQIVESETKYPIQEYKVGTPSELVQMGKIMKKDELSDSALAEDKGSWTCDDFHHILRSRAVCAWGECYVKTKGLR